MPTSSLFLRLLDPTDPTASMRQAAYAFVIIASGGWLSFALYRAPLDGNWVASFGLLLAAVTTGKIMGQPVGVAAPPVPIDTQIATNEPQGDSVTGSAKIGGDA